ncbi:MAG: type III-B CRISPR module RAMP protein Cmr4, partial [Opitutaceae bacterium]|jgi:CRISPR-associated protein Cmr4|nr:type III-B CRISPR module RAMP protein Cmr4 [Opitutaceae bacterium]
MTSHILGLFAETAIHPGAGQSADIIDLPVAREAATGYPVIIGSSFKGALLDYARDANVDEATRNRIFGKPDDAVTNGAAGSLLVSDARLLLLPVRSLDSACKWLTCPHLIARWQRDTRRVKTDTAEKHAALTLPSVMNGEYIGAGTANGLLFLEERQFSKAASNDTTQLVAALDQLIPGDILYTHAHDHLAKQLVIISDDDFAWFAQNALGIQARNSLNEETKESKSLWYEEYIPADALFYAMLDERRMGGAVDTILKLFGQRPYIQLGGNETVGMGWFSISIVPGGNATANQEGVAR